MRRRYFLLVLPAGACSSGPKMPEDWERELAAVREIVRSGDLGQALSRAEEDVNATAANPILHSRFRILKAEILISQGHAQEAEEALLPVDPESLPSTDQVAYWMHRGYGSLGLRRPDDARAFLTRAERISSSLPDKPLAPDIALRIGTLAARTADYRTARERFQAALDLARERGDRYIEAMALGSLARLDLNERRYDEALDRFSQSLEINTQIDSRNALAKDLGNIGLCYSRLGLYDLATGSYQKALELHTSVDNPTDRQTWLGDLGNLNYWRGELDEARTRYEQALKIAREVDRESEWKWLNNLAGLSIDAGDIAAAERYNGQARELEKSVKEPARLIATQINSARIATARNQVEQAEQLYRQSVNTSKDLPDKRLEALSLLGDLYLEQRRPNQAREVLTSAIDLIAQSRQTLRRAESKAGYLASVIRPYRSYTDLLMTEGKSTEALEVADSSRALALSEALEGRPIGTAGGTLAAAKRYPPDTVLLYYWLAPQRSFLWASKAGRMQSFELPAADEIATLVTSYQDRLTRRLRDPIQSGDEAGSKLFETLISPAAHMIGNGAQVVVAPDGALNALNFESLLVPGEKPRFWIEDVELRVTPTPRLTLEQSARVDSHALMLIGDPEPAPNYPRLPSASDELAAVNHEWGASQSTVLRGKQATPRAFLQADLRRFGLIHFAAHAESNEESPLNSAVILSPDQGAFKLYARDVVQKRLNADIVTLSSCRSAGSNALAGEGLMGLAWAFLSAGARNVIAGLWSVSDASTAELMEVLYARLAAGERPAQALRAAKLSLIESGGNYRKPFYWAPFQVYAVG